MFTFLDMEADNVVGIHIDGKINDASFDALVALLEKKMEDHPKVRVYVELKSFKGVSLKTFFKDLKFAFNNWERVDREAIVTQKEWIKKLTEWEDQLFSTIDLKAFSFEEKAQAKKWVQEA